MPSKSYLNFLNLIKDVDELIDAYEVLSSATPPRRNLGCISRGGILMLCASWEFFMEELLLESIELLNAEGISISRLPGSVKKRISLKISDDKNDIKAFDLAESGWRSLWKVYAKLDTELLNTPNQEKLDILYNRYLGISSISQSWTTYSADEINLFIRTRGKIAHKGRSVKGIKITTLRSYFDMIKNTAVDVDSFLSLEIKNIYCLKAIPWSRTYFGERSLSVL